jgi:hypothetical protein
MPAFDRLLAAGCGLIVSCTGQTPAAGAQCAGAIPPLLSIMSTMVTANLVRRNHNWRRGPSLVRTGSHSGAQLIPGGGVRWWRRFARYRRAIRGTSCGTSAVARRRG